MIKINRATLAVFMALAVLAALWATAACDSQVQSDKPSERPVSWNRTNNDAQEIQAYKVSSNTARVKSHRTAVARREAAERAQRAEAARQAAQQQDPLAACRAAHGGSDENCNNADPRIPGTDAYRAQHCPNGAASSPQCGDAGTRSWAQQQNRDYWKNVYKSRKQFFTHHHVIPCGEPGNNCVDVGNSKPLN